MAWPKLGDLHPEQVDACGYEPDLAETHVAALYKRHVQREQ
jgi:hypothetical protein